MSQSSRHAKHHDAPKSTPQATPTANAARQDTDNQPAADRIRLRAYEICQARDGRAGDELADWVQAELEVQADHTSTR